jgi:hypothetical protein
MCGERPGDREALLQAERTVAVPLGHAAARVAHAIYAGAGLDTAEVAHRATVADGVERKSHIHRARPEHRPRAIEADLKALRGVRRTQATG